MHHKPLWANSTEERHAIERLTAEFATLAEAVASDRLRLNSLMAGIDRRNVRIEAVELELNRRILQGHDEGEVVAVRDSLFRLAAVGGRARYLGEVPPDDEVTREAEVAEWSADYARSVATH